MILRLALSSQVAGDCVNYGGLLQEKVSVGERGLFIIITWVRIKF